MKRAMAMMTTAALALAGASAARAQATDPAPVTDGDVTVGWLNGMEILVKRVPSAEWVAGQLYIQGGARNWGKSDAGVEQLALAVAAAGGTEKLDKAQLSHRLAALGAGLHAHTSESFSVMQAKSLRSAWDETFALLGDAFLHPALPPSEIELQRQIQLAQLKHEQDMPDLRLNVMSNELLFQNHPFANRAVGTPQIVAKLDAGQLRAHLGKLRESGRLLLVVVGDIEAAHVMDQARALFGTLPRGAWHDTPLPPLAPAAPRINTVEKKLATNYILSSFVAPTWRDRDLAAAMVAMNVLGFREFLEVRTRRNLSYAPSAALNTRSAVPLGTLYVTAVDPNTTMKVMLDEAQRLGREPVPEQELAGNKAQFLTDYFMATETTDGQAGLLGGAQIYAGDWHVARTLPDRVRAVTAADVQAFAKKYIHRLQTVYLGDPGKLDRHVFDGL